MSSNSDKQENPTRYFYNLALLGTGFAGICILFISAFIWFQPDQLSLSDRYFPSPTATSTRTPTPTPTPNLTATQQVIQATTTMQAIQVIATKAVDQGQVILSDAFETNENDWDTGYDYSEYGRIIRKIGHGTYQWEITADKSNISWSRADTIPVSDFYLAVDTLLLKGTPSIDFGLIFREDTFGNFYYFGINQTRHFTLERSYNDKWTDIIDWTSSSAIVVGKINRLTVIARGDQFLLFINDVFVAEAHDDLIKNGKPALAISLNRRGQEAMIDFDNFILRTP